MALEEWYMKEHRPLLTRPAYIQEMDHFFQTIYRPFAKAAQEELEIHTAKRKAAVDSNNPEKIKLLDLEIDDIHKTVQEVEDNLKAKFLNSLNEIREQDLQLAQQALQLPPDQNSTLTTYQRCSA